MTFDDASAGYAQRKTTGFARVVISLFALQNNSRVTVVR